MKLLRDRKPVEGLQDLIDKCANKENTPTEQCTVRKIGNHKERVGREMRLIAQIGNYEMNQVILDLASEANVLSKQTWERMGRLALQWSLIQL